MRHTFSSPLFHMIVRALVLVILVFSTGVGGMAHVHAASIATSLHSDMLSNSDEAGTTSGMSDHISAVGHCPGLAGICFAIASNSTDLPSLPSSSLALGWNGAAWSTIRGCFWVVAATTEPVTQRRQCERTSFSVFRWLSAQGRA